MGEKLRLETSNKDSEKLSFILRGGNRIKVFLSLAEGIKTPSEIMKLTGINLSSVSRTLREMKDQGIINCQNPKLRHGKLYELSTNMKDFFDHIKASAQARGFE